MRRRILMFGMLCGLGSTACRAKQDAQPCQPGPLFSATAMEVSPTVPGQPVVTTDPLPLPPPPATPPAPAEAEDAWLGQFVAIENLEDIGRVAHSGGFLLPRRSADAVMDGPEGLRIVTHCGGTWCVDGLMVGDRTLIPAALDADEAEINGGEDARIERVIRLAWIDKAHVSVYVAESTYCCGAAHADSQLSCRSFDVASGRPLTLDDVLPADWVRLLREKVPPLLGESELALVTLGGYTGATSFTLTDDGLRFGFGVAHRNPESSITLCMEGDPRIRPGEVFEIPLDALPLSYLLSRGPDRGPEPVVASRPGDDCSGPQNALRAAVDPAGTRYPIPDFRCVVARTTTVDLTGDGSPETVVELRLSHPATSTGSARQETQVVIVEGSDPTRFHPVSPAEADDDIAVTVAAPRLELEYPSNCCDCGCDDVHESWAWNGETFSPVAGSRKVDPAGSCDM